MSDAPGADAAKPVLIHLLDVGTKEYGDAVLLRLGGQSVLVDGGHRPDAQGSTGHPSIPAQLASLLGQSEPINVDLVVVTHAHDDHIGCLPELVATDRLRARWALVADPGLSWGRPLHGAPPDAGVPDSVLKLAAGLREEVPTGITTDADISEFLDAAFSLEKSYNDMLDKLAARGTRVVRWGRSAKDQQALLKEFAGIGLKVLGPSKDQLVACAELIAKRTTDSIDAARELAPTGADAPELASAYRRLVGAGTDEAGALDAQSRPGAMINLQSIVTAFAVGDVSLLLAGDMQFARAETADPIIAAELVKLRTAIKAAGPFDFAKLSHHGSDNAVDATVLDELGAPFLGICAGETSSKHPNPEVLAELKARAGALTWARTDRNGQSTFTFVGGGGKLVPTKGVKNDSTPNTSDVEEFGPPPAEVAPAPVSGQVAPTTQVFPPAPVAAAVPGEVVEVITRVPNRRTRVTVTIDVEPGAPQSTEPAQSAQSPPMLRLVDEPARPALAPFALAGGRQLPKLLFVTNRDILRSHIGSAEAEMVLDTLVTANVLLFDHVPEGSAAVPAVQDELRRHDDLAGVVILGGYGVVPAQLVDCLSPARRASLPANADPDDFYVWSDDSYGNLGDDSLPDLPVSRVPDAKSADLVRAALAATTSAQGQARCGVRNVRRPFADDVYSVLPGAEPLRISSPTTFNQAPAPLLDGELIYLMLHGDFSDGARFWGEGTPGHTEAINLTNIPNPCGSVVFSGCCWGALIASAPAFRAVTGELPGGKAIEASMALTFLARGARAFVGCTGAHYSPLEKPFDYFGAPLHRGFWQHLLAGSPPAKALFEARTEFAAGMPHGQQGELSQAIEVKMFRQYTCLGLGW